MNTDAEEAVRQYGPMLYRLALAQLHSKADAEDVFQEVFLRYLQSAPCFESETHRKAWLLRVTINCCRKVQRSPWRRRVEPLSAILPAQTPEAHLLADLLDALPSRYRAVLHLFYYESLSVEEIASILHRKPSTVRCQLTRGRALLRAELKGEENNA